MDFYAHSANASGESQTLAAHLQGVSALAAQFALAFGAQEAGRTLGLLHDLGKNDSLFQGVLTHTRCHVNHWAAGATVAMNVYERLEEQSLLLANVLYAHHGELGMCPNLRNLLKKQLEGKGDPLDEEGNTLTLFGQARLIQAMRDQQLQLRPVPANRMSENNDADIQWMLWERLLLSALVDADYCDTARHYGQPFTETALNVAAALAALEAKHESLRQGSKAATELNILREQLFNDCCVAAVRPQGLYTLTAPTGMGKTLSLMAFALKHAQQHHLRRIIVTLPYLSLMQQNVTVYREIIPELLESHSMAKITDDTRLLAERWDAPLIVTTSVQFFEALFKSRAPDCRKLHQLAQSVIVFDEAQTLPSQLLPPTLTSLKALCDLAGCTVVFSTATQPSYDGLTNVNWQADEIVQNVPALYQATRRVTYHWRVDKPTALSELATEIAEHTQCLVIVNLRKHARQLAQLLCPLVDADALFYLTTDLCPEHRTFVLAAIRKRLADGLPCTLVATQCVEAGVDLDFPVLYRALAPLESIIQAAGRCNRNGAAPDGQVTVFVPECDGALYPDDWYQWQADCVKMLLAKGPIDPQDTAQIKAYFDLCYLQGAPEKAALAQAIQARDFGTVAREYKLIDDDQYHVVVPYGALPVAIEDVLGGGLSPKLMRTLQPYTVSTYDRKVLDACEVLPLRIPQGKPTKEGSRWYWLDRTHCYDTERFGLKSPDELDVFIQ